MIWTPIISVVVLSMFLTIGDIVSNKTKGYICSIVVTILLLLLFGGTLNVLPPDMISMTNITPIIGIIVIPLLVVNVGSMIDINDLKQEWKTVLVSLAGLLGAVIMGFTIGAFVFGKDIAYSSLAPISGGVVSTMIMTETANSFGREDIAIFVAAVMGTQSLIGLPLSSFCLSKAGKDYIKKGGHKTKKLETHRMDFRVITSTAKILDNPNAHFARLALSSLVAIIFTNLTGLSSSITCLIIGIIFSALGLIERGSLKKAGADGFFLFATWAFVLEPFVSMSLPSFGAMLPSIFGMLMIASVGIIIFSLLMSIFVKWSPYLGIAIGLCCLMGYPYTQVVSTEVCNGLTKDGDFTDEEKENIQNYLLPKMLISGSISVSIASVTLTSFIAPLGFR